MQYIQAYIKPHKLTPLTLALHKVPDFPGMSVSEIKGFGREKSQDSPHSLKDDLVDFIPHVKLEIFCRDEMVNTIINTIQTSAHTGLRGDGKIYVATISQAYRISTGEEGKTAV
ncbi:MAG: P-II family nitrogen regulator [FCB group bacterium]|nr:P-II family nitrogen regulator [FCB group bacterium]